MLLSILFGLAVQRLGTDFLQRLGQKPMTSVTGMKAYLNFLLDRERLFDYNCIVNIDET